MNRRTISPVQAAALRTLADAVGTCEALGMRFSHDDQGVWVSAPGLLGCLGQLDRDELRIAIDELTPKPNGS